MDLHTPFSNLEIAFKNIFKIKMCTRCKNIKPLKSKIKLNKNLQALFLAMASFGRTHTHTRLDFIHSIQHYILGSFTF